MKTTNETVLPSNYIRWDVIGKAEHLNIDRLTDTVRITFAKLNTKYIEMQFPSFKKFAAYYNTYSNGLITDPDYNRFFYHTKLEPVAHLFKLFVENRVSRTRTDCGGGNVREVSDFGILRSHYEYFKKHGRPPEVHNRGRLKKVLTPEEENKRTKIEFEGGGALDVPKNEIYMQFRDGIKAANAVSKQKVSVPQMTLLAMQMFIESRQDVFGALEQKIAPDALIRKKTNSRISGEIDPELVARMTEVIERYNSANATPINQSQFLEMAVKGMIERLPVQYVDPELARELRDI